MKSIYVAKSYVSPEALARGIERAKSLGFTVPSEYLKDEYDYILIDPVFKDAEYADLEECEDDDATRVYSEQAVMAFFDEFEAQDNPDCATCDETECEDSPAFIDPSEDFEDEDSTEGNNLIIIESPLANVDIATESATIGVDITETLIKIRIGLDI